MCKPCAKMLARMPHHILKIPKKTREKKNKENEKKKKNKDPKQKKQGKKETEKKNTRKKKNKERKDRAVSYPPYIPLCAPPRRLLGRVPPPEQIGRTAGPRHSALAIPAEAWQWCDQRRGLLAQRQPRVKVVVASGSEGGRSFALSIFYS